MYTLKEDRSIDVASDKIEHEDIIHTLTSLRGTIGVNCIAAVTSASVL
jgi:hypothetical protein